MSFIVDGKKFGGSVARLKELMDLRKQVEKGYAVNKVVASGEVGGFVGASVGMEDALKRGPVRAVANSSSSSIASSGVASNSDSQFRMPEKPTGLVYSSEDARFFDERGRLDWYMRLVEESVGLWQVYYDNVRRANQALLDIGVAAASVSSSSSVRTVSSKASGTSWKKQIEAKYAALGERRRSCGSSVVSLTFEDSRGKVVPSALPEVPVKHQVEKLGKLNVVESGVYPTFSSEVALQNRLEVAEEESVCDGTDVGNISVRGEVRQLPVRRVLRSLLSHYGVQVFPRPSCGLKCWELKGADDRVLTRLAALHRWRIEVGAGKFVVNVSGIDPVVTVDGALIVSEACHSCGSVLC